MKLLLTLLMASSFIACTKKPMEDPAKTVINPEASQVNMDEASDEIVNQEDSEEQAIVEENNECICTKEYMPVCGDNGVTYPNKCQAGCVGITEFTDGPCQ